MLLKDSLVLCSLAKVLLRALDFQLRHLGPCSFTFVGMWALVLTPSMKYDGKHARDIDMHACS